VNAVPEVVRQQPKAKLVPIKLGDGDAPSQELGSPAPVEVQFNPETLKVTYSNSVSGGDQAGSAAKQFVSKSSTKLAVELWFDASAKEGAGDVRADTQKVLYFFKPVDQGKGKAPAPPPVRFQWGSFLFEGVMDSMDETLEFFSADGRALRAKVSISISRQDIQLAQPAAASSGGGVPGTTPRTQAKAGDSLQAMIGRARGTGAGAEGWQAIAAANGIENPRRLEPGSFVDLDAGIRIGVGG
jgi:hypothetical protein